MKIDEAVKTTGAVEDEFQAAQEIPQVDTVVDEHVEAVPGIKFNLTWLRTPTGDGSIDDYMDHPLNFFKSRGFAQMLRGLTGFFGNLKLAVIDIALGGFQFAKERQVPKSVAGGIDHGAL